MRLWIARLFKPRWLKNIVADYKTEISIGMFCVGVVLTAFGVEVPKELWAFATGLLGVGIAHNEIKTNKEAKEIKALTKALINSVFEFYETTKDTHGD